MTDLQRRLEAGDVRCAVVGLGFIGSTLMDALASAGFEARGFDRAPDAVARFLERPPPPGVRVERRSAGSDPAALAEAEVAIVAVRLPVDGGGSADLEPLRTVAAALCAHSAGPRLTLVAATVPPGTTRAFAGWLRGTGEDFVAHVPERIAVGHDWRVLRGTPHLVGGVDKASGALAAAFVSRLCASAVPVSSAEVAELAKLLENAFRSQAISLTTEIVQIARGLGISAAEVCAAAATKPFGYFPFHPGYGVGGHCLPADLRMLRGAGRAHGYESRLLEEVQAALARQPEIVVNRLQDLLGGELALPGAPVLLVGMGFKVGSGDVAASPAAAVVRALRVRGADPWYLDDSLGRLEVDGTDLPRFSAADDPTRLFAAIVLLGGSRATPLRDLVRHAPLVLDAGGGRIMSGDGVPVETL